jgi:hypothetical protein
VYQLCVVSPAMMKMTWPLWPYRGLCLITHGELIRIDIPIIPWEVLRVVGSVCHFWTIWDNRDFGSYAWVKVDSSGLVEGWRV